MQWQLCACLEHSDLLTGTCPRRERVHTARRNGPSNPHPERCGSRAGVQEGRPEGMNGAIPTKEYDTGADYGGALGNLTTSFLSAAKLIYAIGAGVTAAAGTRLALQLLLDVGFVYNSFPFADRSPQQLFLVATSANRHWVICAPAAFLRCGSRLSGSLSGIEP